MEKAEEDERGAGWVKKGGRRMGKETCRGEEGRGRSVSRKGRREEVGEKRGRAVSQ